MIASVMKFEKIGTDPVRNKLICNEIGELIDKLDFGVKNLCNRNSILLLKYLF